MRIVGSFTPNSAAAERVFSLLKNMYGDQQMTALADMIQAALMLKYNKRPLGYGFGGGRLSVGWQIEWGVVDFTGHDSALATSGMQLVDRKFCENLCVFDSLWCQEISQEICWYGTTFVCTKCVCV